MRYFFFLLVLCPGWGLTRAADTTVLPDSALPKQSAADTITFREFTFEECQQYLDKRTFRSKEGLLQLFYMIYYSDTVNHIILKRPTIKSLHKSIRSYFPLKRCQKIVYSNKVLWLQFSRKQKIYIPGTWRQATLRMSKKLMFKVTTAPNDPQLLCFEVAEGGVLVTTSAFLRIFTPFAINVKGQSLFYKIEADKNQSIIGMKHFNTIPGDKIVINQDPREVKVDVQIKNMPDSVDMYFRNQELHYFGITIRLLEDGVIQCNRYKPERKPEGYAWFRYTIDSVLNDPEGKLKNGVQRTVRVTYNLEKRKVWFWQGFDFIN
jgi:hypothetical protein